MGRTTISATIPMTITSNDSGQPCGWCHRSTDWFASTHRALCVDCANDFGTVDPPRAATPPRVLAEARRTVAAIDEVVAR